MSVRFGKGYDRPTISMEEARRRSGYHRHARTIWWFGRPLGAPGFAYCDICGCVPTDLVAPNPMEMPTMDNIIAQAESEADEQLRPFMGRSAAVMSAFGITQRQAEVDEAVRVGLEVYRREAFLGSRPMTLQEAAHWSINVTGKAHVRAFAHRCILAAWREQHS